MSDQAKRNVKFVPEQDKLDVEFDFKKIKSK